MKKLSAILLAVLIIDSASFAQNRNLNVIRKKFYAEFERLEKQGKIEKEDKDGDGLMQQFRRWEYLMKSRTHPSGVIPDGSTQWKEWQRYQSRHADQFAGLAALPPWQQVGTNAVPSLGGGAGRVNVIRFDPVNTNIIYIGTASGGVWKTVNGGAAWMSLSDQYPVTSIADIAIDATDGDNIYVATGDCAGYEVANDDFWGGVYTAGILRSTDGGATWAQVARELPQDLRTIIQRLVINPSNPGILLAATRKGIYRTTNGGTSWTKVLNNHCYDIEWNTGNPAIAYAGGDGVLYKSNNGGATWNTLRSGLGIDRMSIEVSASDPQVIYTLTGSTFYRSGDGGTTWTLKSYPYGASFYGYYDLVLSCAPANSNYLIAGGLNTVGSTNGGSSWQSIDNWSDYTAANYVHADKHHAIFYPSGTTNILVGTDGGIFKTMNGGNTWSDLSNGLMIAQIYRLGTTPQNVNLITSGWQDNGCNKWDGTNWTRIFGADGMETAIDYTNQNIIYECYQYGALNRSNNGGVSWSYISPSSGDWVTPFVIDPIVNTRLYYGSFSLYKTENRGNSWSVVSGVNFDDYTQAIAVAPSNNNIVYAASLSKIYRIDISTGNATVITSGLPVNEAGINYIAVSGSNPNKVWVALAGYSDGNKVYRSTNGGSSWSNVSGSLPNLPINTIVYQNNSNRDRVYIGTDIGVYAIDSTLPDWIYFGNKLPNVMVHELEINYTSNKLIAATYGRGIWQVDIPVTQLQQMVKNNILPELKANVFPNPTTGLVNIQVQNTKSDVSVNVYKLTGEKVAAYHFGAEAGKTIQIDLSTQPFGNYILHLQSGEAITTKTIALNK
jgi:photosystem II stability/assembly factor-like uncharacterized protein